MMGLNRKFASVTMLFLIVVSFFGLALAVFFVVNPPAIQEDSALRKPAVGSALRIICVLGVLAVLYPDSCAGIAGLKKQGETVHGSQMHVHGSCEQRHDFV